MNRKSIFVLCLFLAGCSSCLKSTKEPLTHNVSACNNLRKLKCKEANDLVYPIKCTSNKECKDGTCVKGRCTETCEQVFEAFVKNGKYVGLECISKVNSCDKIEKKCRK